MFHKGVKRQQGGVNVDGFDIWLDQAEYFWQMTLSVIQRPPLFCKRPIVNFGFELQRGIKMFGTAVPIPASNPNCSRHSKCVWRALGLNTFLDQSFDLSQSFYAPVNSTKVLDYGRRQPCFQRYSNLPADAFWHNLYPHRSLS